MAAFGKRVLFLGYGAVARCALPLFMKHVQVPMENVTVLDFEDRSEELRPWTAQGVRFVRDRVTPENLGRLLDQFLSDGDLLVDLAWNIECGDLLEWARHRGVLYVNTSIETWDPYTDAHKRLPTERTLYWRRMKLRRLVESWPHSGPTAVLEHGANPGLISHWTKQGLVDLAERFLDDSRAGSGRAEPHLNGHSAGGAEAEKIRHWIQTRAYNRLAQALGVKVIHCSERDTQVTNRPKAVDEFVNTWSIEGFREEGTTTAEMGWGTHEKELPTAACEHDDGPKNQICLARMGMNTWVRSWVPYYSIRGMVIRHGEAFTISDFLTVWEDGRPVYRPTVHYAYCPCDAAIASLQELRAQLPLAAESAHPARRDCRRLGHLGRAAARPRLQRLVDRQRPVDRGVAAVGAAPERHHGAGGDLRRRRRAVDDGEPLPRRLLAGTTAPRVRPQGRQSLFGQVSVPALQLDAAARGPTAVRRRLGSAV